MQNEKLLSDIQSSDKDVRFAAWRAAGDADASAIGPLSALVDKKDNPGVAKAAREAITTMAHAVGADASNPKRVGVVKALLTVANNGSAGMQARVLAFRLLSGIADEGSVGAIARHLGHAELREEAIYCVERIPGPVSIAAIVTAYKSAKDDFKPRLLAALGHRRAEEGVALAVDAMRSANAEVAAAGARALGRIGKRANVVWPQNADPDAILRYADGLRESGQSADALRLYQTMLGNREAHLQCAAIVGLSRIGTAPAAAALHPMLKNSNSRVRITAVKAWNAMAVRAARSGPVNA